MSPKEKAEDLVNKFSKYAHWNEGSSNNNFSSQNCALIAVEEIINEFEYNSNNDKKYGYWQQVKKEIELL